MKDELEDLPDPKKTVHMSMEQAGFNNRESELLWLLGVAILRLGGALVVRPEERPELLRVSVAFDIHYERENPGGIRLYAVLEEPT